MDVTNHAIGVFLIFAACIGLLGHALKWKYCVGFSSPKKLLGGTIILALTLLSSSDYVFGLSIIFFATLFVGDQFVLDMVQVLRGRPKGALEPASAQSRKLALDRDVLDADQPEEAPESRATEPSELDVPVTAMPAASVGEGPVEGGPVAELKLGSQLATHQPIDDLAKKRSRASWLRDEYLRFEDKVFDALPTLFEGENARINRRLSISNPGNVPIYVDGIVRSGPQRLLIEVKLSGRRTSIEDAVSQLSDAIAAYKMYARSRQEDFIVGGILVIPSQERQLPPQGEICIAYFDKDARVFTNRANVLNWYKALVDP